MAAKAIKQPTDSKPADQCHKDEWLGRRLAKSAKVARVQQAMGKWTKTG